MSCSGVNDIATTTNWALWSRQFTYHCENFFCHLEPTNSHTHQGKKVGTDKTSAQTRQLQLHARTTSRHVPQTEGRVSRSLWPTPSVACPGQPYVCCVRVIATGCGHTRQARAYSRLSSSRFIVVICSSTPLPTHFSQKSGVGHTAVENEKAHSLMSAHLVFRAKMWAFINLILSCNSATAMGLVATSAGFMSPGILTILKKPRFTRSCTQRSFTSKCLTHPTPDRLTIPTAAELSTATTRDSSRPIPRAKDCTPISLGCRFDESGQFSLT